MHQVFRRLLRAYDIRLIPTAAAQPDLLIIPPNGALLDIYQAPSIVRDQLARQPDIPLVIFPSSSRFQKVDPAQMFGARRSPSTWVLRESYSYDHLQEKWGETLGNAGVSPHFS
jgi:hypothetical protein